MKKNTSLSILLKVVVFILFLSILDFDISSIKESLSNGMTQIILVAIVFLVALQYLQGKHSE